MAMRISTKRLERGVRNLVRGLPGEQWERRPFVSRQSPVFIGGCGRSGTTLISQIINAHPNLCCGQETRLLTSPGLNPARLARHYEVDEQSIRQWTRESESKGAFVERFFAEVAGREGKQRWAEKTPGNVLVLDRILSTYPNARFIHVIRDGRDVACSYRTNPKFKLVNGERVPTNIRRPIAECAQRWNDYVRAGIRHRGEVWYYELRYEELIENPERVLREMFAFIDEPWKDCVLEFHTQDGPLTRHVEMQRKPINASAQGRWRNDLSSEDAQIVKRIAGALLIELGYSTDLDWSHDEPSSDSAAPDRSDSKSQPEASATS